MSMTGQLSGFTIWVKEIASECESMHCVIHREILVAENCHLNLATLVDLSTWIVYHGDSLILSNICASTSYAVSSIHLVMVPAKRGICATT